MYLGFDKIPYFKLTATEAIFNIFYTCNKSHASYFKLFIGLSFLICCHSWRRVRTEARLLGTVVLRRNKTTAPFGVEFCETGPQGHTLPGFSNKYLENSPTRLVFFHLSLTKVSSSFPPKSLRPTKVEYIPRSILSNKYSVPALTRSQGPQWRYTGEHRMFPANEELKIYWDKLLISKGKNYSTMEKLETHEPVLTCWSKLTSPERSKQTSASRWIPKTSDLVFQPKCLNRS